MKKRSHLHTNFIKFIIEKYNKEIQGLPDEETNVSNKEIVDEFDEIINGKEIQKDEVQDEIEDDETIDDLVKEFQLLEKKYNFKTNDSIRNKRK
jgi:hypothetical protein